VKLVTDKARIAVKNLSVFVRYRLQKCLSVARSGCIPLTYMSARSHCGDTTLEVNGLVVGVDCVPREGGTAKLRS